MTWCCLPLRGSAQKDSWPLRRIVGFSVSNSNAPTLNKPHGTWRVKKTRWLPRRYLLVTRLSQDERGPPPPHHRRAGSGPPSGGVRVDAGLDAARGRPGEPPGLAGGDGVGLAAGAAQPPRL